jgi:RNA polymerase sigma factor (sigma-70 family)
VERALDPSSREWEQALHARLVAGEEAALGELYDQFSPMVYGMAVRITGDRAAAEDVTQEVFAYAWERADAYDRNRGRLRTWLATIAHHRAVDSVRSSQARRRHAAAEVQEQRLAPDVEEAAVAAAVAKCVRAAVDRLPDPQRTAIMLAYFEGKTFRQVADVLGIPEGTAKSRLRLGLRRIADQLEAEGVIATRRD